MSRDPLPERARQASEASHGWQAGPIQDLTALLLQRLLDENGGAGFARVVVGPNPGDPRDPWLDGASDSWKLSVPAAAIDGPDDGEGPVTLKAVLSTGRTLTLTIGGLDHGALQARAERYLLPIRTVVDLGLRRRAQRLDAQAAVDAVEGMALLDLATGIVMARRSTDPQFARDALAAWSLRTGTSVGDLTTNTMLELLTGEDFQPG